MIRYSDQRYLLSKKTVDDRALNRPVLQALTQQLAGCERPQRVLELGAGVGTMVCRLADWRVLPASEYTLVDRDRDSLIEARRQLRTWGLERGSLSGPVGSELEPLTFDTEPALRVRFVHANALDYVQLPESRRRFDLVIANAVLDLMNLRPALGAIWQAMQPNSPYWFSINFDGGTTLLPDEDLDERIIGLYHSTMDERRWQGQPAGDSRTGRRLLLELPRSGASLLAAGSSDWVVFPQGGGYSGDEAYFLHHIVHTIDGALRGHPALPAAELATWVSRRHAQIEAGELCYVAHQLDVCGQAPSS